MSGMACFTGTRVPIDNVLGSPEESMGLSEFQEHYDFLTVAHVEAAKAYRAPPCPGELVPART